MKMFKSIKWRLQIWYGLILVVVLAGFGFIAFQLERGKIYREFDNELIRRAGTLATALRPPPRGPGPDRPPFDQPPPDRLPGDNPPGEDLRPPPQFHLPPQAAGLFGTNDPDDFYFIINSRDGNELARSANAPKVEVVWNLTFAKGDTLPQVHPDFLHSLSVQTFGKIREMLQTLPPGETIRVGCSIAPELKELRLTALKLTTVGGIILFFGLAGGWWFVGRALQPISGISATATKISAGDLSQRINVAEAESELGQLAAVLNSTFARLEKAFAQQKQFASDAAHELRTPVSVMLTQTQTALNREREAADYKQTVEACQRAAQRMRKLIESLLELARFDAGQEILKRLRFNFSKTVADCIALMKPLADGRGVKIFTELSPLEITGDSGRLAQVVTNLLMNAIQYNREGGQVRVKLESQNGLAILTVSDTGGGISAEDLPRVFERFYRANQARSSGNTGLGLAISRAIVEAHGGTLEVSSEENVGTTFTVHMPRGL
ncbi:MAG: ATP-binding protein [Verrucomicrobiota bacterium]|jgi:heavy metal sensor kinase